jgi:hypothetical protein
LEYGKFPGGFGKSKEQAMQEVDFRRVDPSTHTVGQKRSFIFFEVGKMTATPDFKYKEETNFRVGHCPGTESCDASVTSREYIGQVRHPT